MGKPVPVALRHRTHVRPDVQDDRFVGADEFALHGEDVRRSLVQLVAEAAQRLLDCLFVAEGQGRVGGGRRD